MPLAAGLLFTRLGNYGATRLLPAGAAVPSSLPSSRPSPTGHAQVQIPFKKVGICASIASAEFATTTEVYPDSAKTNAEECNRAQAAAVVGALEYILGGAAA